MNPQLRSLHIHIENHSLGDLPWGPSLVRSLRSLADRLELTQGSGSFPQQFRAGDHDYITIFAGTSTGIIDLPDAEGRDQMQRDFNDAINFAIADSEARAFLAAWREGDWETLREEWPEFKLPSSAT